MAELGLTPLDILEQKTVLQTYVVSICAVRILCRVCIAPSGRGDWPTRAQLMPHSTLLAKCDVRRLYMQIDSRPSSTLGSHMRVGCGGRCHIRSMHVHTFAPSCMSVCTIRAYTFAYARISCVHVCMYGQAGARSAHGTCGSR